MTDQCSSCRFWRADPDYADSEPAYGRCRVSPPTLVHPVLAHLMPQPRYGEQVDPDIDAITLFDASQQPVTEAGDWCGGYVGRAAAQSQIQAAFAEMRDAYAGLNALPVNASDDECEVFHSRIDAARDAIKETSASSPLDVAIKLRTGMTGINQGAAEQLLLYRLAPAGEAIFDDWFENLIYSTIVELEGGQ